MAETGKKVEVRYGAFACRVEGFDDPVEPLREVLLLMQRVIAETPAMADQHPALDDGQIARIGEALSRRRTDDQAHPGIIVIRSGDRAEGAVEDAEILADADRQGHGDGSPPPFAAGGRPAADPWRADAGPHPSAAVYAAPAAAAAEAAFAASVAAAAPPDAGVWQSPLGREEPDDPATSAALFAAPAADVADAASADRFAPAARPADPDDDAEDPDLRSADEAADERVQAADPDLAEAAGAASGMDEATAVGRSDGGPAAAGRHHAEPESAAPERADAVEHARPPGVPGESWSPWASSPDGTAAVQPPPRSPASVQDRLDSAVAEPDAAPEPAFREPSPDHGDAEDGTLPVINIFAPPPSECSPAIQSEQDSGAEVSRTAPPWPPDRGEPDLGAADGEVLSDSTAGMVPDRRHAAAPDETADVLDDDDRPDGADAPDDVDAPGASPHDSAENRLAALITRYRSGVHGHAGREAEPDAALASLSAAELAERAGAAEVEDLLAVSAAWLALSDGRTRFTRRDVMEVFETLPGSHPRTLEARIKGFGSLVRAGTLEVVEDGVFLLAPRERARFRTLIDQG